jgi:N-acetylglutamate synthase-like GNAT family acetyltransferase
MMLVRKFNPEDADQISRLIVRNLKQETIRDYSPEAIEALVPHYAPDILIELSKNSYMIVCIHGDDLVGTATLDRDRVRNVFVDIDMHRQGIGKLLMADLEAHAIAKNLKSIYLHAGLSSEGFYHKLGYEPIKRIEHELDGTPLPVIKMEKVLPKV